MDGRRRCARCGGCCSLPEVGQDWLETAELQDSLCRARLQDVLRLHSQSNVDGERCIGGSVVVVLLLSRMHEADLGGQSLARGTESVKIGDRRCRRGPRLVPVVMTERCNAALVKVQVKK